MSECLFSVTNEGRTFIFEDHYARGILDHEKYHLQNIRDWNDPEAIISSEHNALLVAYHQELLDSGRLDGLSPRCPGCEREALMAKCWIVSTPDQERNWVSMVRKKEVVGHIEECALQLNFDTKHVVIVSRLNFFCNWQDYLPDGWTFALDNELTVGRSTS